MTFCNYCCLFHLEFCVIAGYMRRHKGWDDEKSIQADLRADNQCFGCGPHKRTRPPFAASLPEKRLWPIWQPETYQEAFPGVLSGGDTEYGARPLQLDCRELHFDESGTVSIIRPEPSAE